MPVSTSLEASWPPPLPASQTVNREPTHQRSRPACSTLAARRTLLGRPARRCTPLWERKHVRSGHVHRTEVNSSSKAKLH